MYGIKIIINNIILYTEKIKCFIYVCRYIKQKTVENE